MINAELLAKIKAEIERRKSLLIQHSKLTYDLIIETFIKEYDDLLSFLSALESEKPMSQEELEEEINRTYHDGSVTDTSDLDHVSYENIARYFAQWQKEQDTRDMYMSDNRHFNKVYELGKKDMKEQMLKEAVSGWLDEDNEPPYDLNVVCEEKIPFGKFKHGDKVRIIIVKEDEK